MYHTCYVLPNKCTGADQESRITSSVITDGVLCKDGGQSGPMNHASVCIIGGGETYTHGDTP
jgi:hypothetical protein